MQSCRDFTGATGLEPATSGVNDVQHSTNTFTLTASDGSHFVAHETFHLGTNAAGEVVVNFDKMDMHMTCG
jgi:hypothetical protein